MSDGWIEDGYGGSEAIFPSTTFPESGTARRSAGATPAQRIRVLHPRVAQRIAAGEVVERPSSVVKELIENALDAGARAIRIDVLGGGLRLIRVGDDGCGIPPDDMWLACQRHATSKLPADDLGSIRTLGFRGEALPSIATVAELSISSAIDNRGVGQRLTLVGGRVVVDEPAPRPRGTTVTVRGLFETVPVRLAGAQRVQTEVTHIGQTVRHLALSAPEVRFTLLFDERSVLRTSGSGDSAIALTEVLGEAVAGSVMRLGRIEVSEASISGVTCGGDVTRPGRGLVNVIVNGRWVQPRGMMALLETAYRPLLPRGRHPVMTVSVETAPHLVDVNVHPAKLEVRLLHERSIGMAAGSLLRDTLGRRPFRVSAAPSLGIGALPRTSALAETGVAYDEESVIVTPHLPPLRLVGQIQSRLVMLDGAEGIYFVDQHRAHERVIWEELSASRGQTNAEPDLLQEPILLELRPSQADRLGRQLDTLNELGFDIQEFGGRSFLIRALPKLPETLGAVVLPGSDSSGVADHWTQTLLALADEDPGEGEGWQERLLVSLSCRAAVRRGQQLDRAAMTSLITALGHTTAPAVCPHGSPLLMHINGSLLEKQFGWR